MIALATLDPSTLALWFDPTAVSNPENAKLCSEAQQSACARDLDRFTSFYDGLGAADKPLAANIASSIWHEKRHFLDLVLTNYGAYRVRHFLMLAYNAMPVLKELERQAAPPTVKKIAFPLHVYDDMVRRELAGVIAPPDGVRALVSAIKKRKRALDWDSQVFNIQGQPCAVGGEAQLEALALSSQLAANQCWLGDEGAVKWQRGLGENWLNTRYRWAEMIAHKFGLLPTRLFGDEEAIDFTLITAILYASLMMRSWDQTYEHPELGAMPLTPAHRLMMLLESFRGHPWSFSSLSVTEAWELVNQRCAGLFGRTAVEELETDYEKEGRIVGSFPREDPAGEAFSSFHELRGKFIELLKREPRQILDLRWWSDWLLPELQPVVVIANSSGVYGKPPAGLEAVLQQSSEATDGWWWAVAESNAETGRYALAGKPAWLFVLRYLSPLAKLMLSGRRHQLMLGPEILSMEQELRRIGFEIYFEPMFEFPVEGDDTADFYGLTTKEHFKCDFCGENVPRGQGRMFGPWTIRQNHRLAQCCVLGLGGGDLGFARFWKDWSHWHICPECLEKMTLAGFFEDCTALQVD